MAMFFGLVAGVLLAFSHTQPSVPAGDKAAKDAQTVRAAIFFGGALLVGLMALILGFIGYEGQAALSTAPAASRKDALNSLNSPGLLCVTATYILGYIGWRILYALRSRRA